MREVAVNELSKYVDPVNMRSDPAIALASDGKETNGLTIGWLSTGTLWSKPCCTVYVHKTRYSKHIFDGAEYFSVCFLKSENRSVVGYFGRVSGRDENKMKNCGLTVETDGAPYFAQSRVVILCKVMGKSDFDPASVDTGVSGWYQKEGVHTQYYGEIVKVLVSE